MFYPVFGGFCSQVVPNGESGSSGRSPESAGLECARMTFAEKLTLASAVGTCGAAVATLLTVLEMRWQRRTTYRPDLIAEATGFEIYPDGTDHFATISVDGKRPTGRIARQAVSLTIRNAGFGPAKNLTYSWETDVLAFLE